jgi:hypothetical protein
MCSRLPKTQIWRTADELVLALLLVTAGPVVLEVIAVHLNDAPVVFSSGKWSV